jgi:hypothetical protein
MVFCVMGSKNQKVLYVSPAYTNLFGQGRHRLGEDPSSLLEWSTWKTVRSYEPCALYLMFAVFSSQCLEVFAPS